MIMSLFLQLSSQFLLKLTEQLFDLEFIPFVGDFELFL